MKSLWWVFLLAVLVLVACGGDATDSDPTATAEPAPTQAPSPTPDPTPVPEPTSAPAAPTPSSTSENPILPTVPVPLEEPTVDNIAARKLARAGIRTNLIRGLTLVAPLETVLERQMVTSDEFRELISGVHEGRRDKIESDQLLYETLGLMRPGVTLYDVLLTFSTEGTLGWFDLENERQYVVLDSEELTLSHERTYVNEYVNHLQAVNFDIKAKYDATEGNDDARLALRAVLEGDSAIGEFVYTSEHFTTEEQEASILEPNEAFREALNMAPYIALRTFVFPFAEGLDFAVQLFQTAGNWSLINQTLETPPVSTEQVLHLDKYAAGELPIDVEMPDVSWVIGDEWEHVRTGVLGELFIMAWLETDFSPQAAFIAAQGWGGDAYSLFEGPDGQGLLVLATVWDSEQDAEEFFVTMQQHAEARSGVGWDDSAIGPDAATLALPDRTVYAERNGARILQIYAPSAELVDTVRQAAASPLELE
ncbi:MAG: hypothetical protein OXK79_10280 [Chloroflexota bacterium]|nr:hypothetical protein [Chloroflexota bacterium]